MPSSQHNFSEERSDENVIEESNIRGLEARVEKITEQMQNLRDTLTQQMENAQQQSNDIERELGILVERINVGGGTQSGFAQDFSGLNELYNKMQLIQVDIENLSNTTARLMEERDDKQCQMNIISGQVEKLMAMKADREEIDDVLDDKANLIDISKKVSREEFCTALEDLTRALEATVKKLNDQESLWIKALDSLQSDVVNKLDKKEMNPLKLFINEKLRSLHEILKQLTKVRKDTEAAATKKRLSKDIHCLSCDLSAYMRTDLCSNVPMAQPFIPRPSMRPFLTYELDMIRKDKKRLPTGKSLNYLQDALALERKMKASGPERPASFSVGNYCNRYCGGSHTLTAPHQRVVRTCEMHSLVGRPPPLPSKPDREKNSRKPQKKALARQGPETKDPKLIN